MFAERHFVRCENEASELCLCDRDRTRCQHYTCAKIYGV